MHTARTAGHSGFAHQQLTHADSGYVFKMGVNPLKMSNGDLKIYIKCPNSLHNKMS
jgi:hypothetical protein